MIYVFHEYVLELGYCLNKAMYKNFFICLVFFVIFGSNNLQGYAQEKTEYQKNMNLIKGLMAGIGKNLSKGNPFDEDLLEYQSTQLSELLEKIEGLTPWDDILKHPGFKGTTILRDKDDYLASIKEIRKDAQHLGFFYNKRHSAKLTYVDLARNCTHCHKKYSNLR